MSKSDRLFRLLHLMRSLSSPVTASRLAAESGVSERTLYRDIETLRAGGALIDGAAGYGYTLTEDPALPPQMFTRLEVEALILGLSQVHQTTDPALAAAARAAQAKIIASVPERVQRQAINAVLQVYRNSPRAIPAVDMSLIREACWEERALDVTYADAASQVTRRRIWPLSVVFLDQSEMLLAWCCLRQDFRKFLLERIAKVHITDESFRPRRVPLLRDFIARMRKGDAKAGSGLTTPAPGHAVPAPDQPASGA